MEIETILFAAVQSSFLLGLLHGINPCGHSWLVLAPFVTGERDGKRVMLLTVAFLSGTALACLILGAGLGAISQVIPESIGVWVETGTSLILIALGALLLYNPHILHHHDNHDHHHCHGHSCTHDHGHDHSSEMHREEKKGLFRQLHHLTAKRELLPFALFGIGFVNMIVPCPTAALMYGYALNAGNSLAATIVFASYALSTAIAVGGVIYLIFKATEKATALQKDWVEPFIMRSAGVVIIIFSLAGLYNTYNV